MTNYINGIARITRSPWRRGLVVGLLMAGCSHKPVDRSDRARVEGAVTFAGKPLPGGSISFVSKENARMRVTGLLRSDGTYSISDVPLGAVNVTVDTECVRLGNAANYVRIPPRYTNLKTSGLQTTVAAEGNKYEIQLVN